MRRRTSPRGQAMIEFTLGAILLLGVLLMGIHFAEFGQLKLKVQQAATNATFETASQRYHDLDDKNPDPNAPGSPVFETVAQFSGAGRPWKKVEADYEDFNAARSNGPGIRLVATRSDGPVLSCERARVAPFDRLDLDRLFVAFRNPGPLNNPFDGARCEGSANLSVFNVPVRFLSNSQGQGGFFKRELVKRSSSLVCAYGRRVNGQCRGGLSIAVDDWSLGGSSPGFGNESGQCNSGCMHDANQGNLAFRASVERLYRDYRNEVKMPGSRAASVDTFVRTLFQLPADAVLPVDQQDFRFVFIGEDGDPSSPTVPKKFMSPTLEVADSLTATVQDDWPASPYSEKYREAYQERGRCLFGAKCSRSAFNKKTGW